MESYSGLVREEETNFKEERQVQAEKCWPKRFFMILHVKDTISNNFSDKYNFKSMIITSWPVREFSDRVQP